MKAKLTLNGKEYEVELTEDQVSKIECASKAKTGFNLGREWNEWYVSDLLGNGDREPIFSSRELCGDYARAINLFLQLSEWQAKNDVPIKQEKWYELSFLDGEINSIEIGGSYYFGAVKFSSREKAGEAIEHFRDELTWYFTEFRRRLDE